ncbi:APC family permease [Ruminococcus sp. OA3]|uniref:APC family permease n=1 Tax=Ruminococcus sp. OA3 TaxID=2914164 RepID=UPI001F06367F|nr:APC family permease [Ruminococcus sp. OA3]MCH1981151.1 APC family permease [Ruminococcus sp. OA3]
MNSQEKKLSCLETTGLAVGFTIGSGIITQTGIGIAMTGRSIVLAFLVSALLFLISFRPIFIMSTLLPRTSAAFSYSSELIHEDVGKFYAYIYFLGRMTIAIFGISFAQYLASLIPSLNHPAGLKLTALSVLTLFYIINLFGVKTAARFQNVLCLILIAGILCFVLRGLGKVDFREFTSSETFFTGDFGGFYSAVSLLYFAVGGSYIITDFAPKIKNASKIMVKVITGVTLCVCLLYMLMGIVASGVMPVSEVAGKPLTTAASAVLGSGGLYAFFIIGACLGALITTLNSSFVWYSNSLIAACEKGCFPESWAKTNRFGAPYILMTIFYCFGAVPTVAGIDLTILSKMAVGLTILGTCIPMAGILSLPKKYPELWGSSKYARKYPAWRLKLMVIITYLVLSTQVISLFANNPAWSNIIIIAYAAIVIAVLAAGRLYRRKSFDDKSGLPNHKPTKEGNHYESKTTSKTTW